MAWLLVSLWAKHIPWRRAAAACPAILHVPETEDRNTVERVKAAAAEIGTRLRALRPDLWIIFANDHVEQFFHTSAPPFTIHVGDEAKGEFAGRQFHWRVLRRVFAPRSSLRDHHRDLGDAGLPGGEYPGMAGNQSAVLAHQRRRRPAPLLDARRDCRNLSVRVGPGVFRIRDQPVDRPPLDLVGRPRSLISGGLTRACARTR
jgi:hypothetical protein